MRKPIFRPREEALVQGWITKHPVFTSLVDRLHRQVASTDDPFSRFGGFQDLRTEKRNKRPDDALCCGAHLLRMVRSFWLLPPPCMLPATGTDEVLRSMGPSVLTSIPSSAQMFHSPSHTSS